MNTPIIPSPRGFAARVLLGMISCLAFAFSGTTFAQSADLDDAAKHFGKVLMEGHIRRVIAADFVANGGSVTLQGVFLADKFLALLEPQNEFQRLDRSSLRKSLYGRQTLADDGSPKMEMKEAHDAGAEGLITGTIEQHSENLSITITAWNVSTGQTIAQQTISVPRTKSLDDLAMQSIQSAGPIYLAGQNGVSIPRCLYCPSPLRNEAARKEKLKGNVVLSAIIEPSGRAGNILEARGLGDGLTEQAMEIVRQWRFSPAHDANDKPVAVMVTLEVVFRDF